MGRVLKISVSVAASLVFVFLLVFSQSTASPVSANTEASGQSPAAYSANQEVIARYTVKSQKELELLLASGGRLLAQRSDEDAYILTSFAKFEELEKQGWSATLLYVRNLEDNQDWRSVAAPSGDQCTYSVSPIDNSFAAGQSASTFDLTTGATCEWTAFTDFGWLQVNGVGQGTGSKTISYGVFANPTSSNRIGHIFIGGQVFTVYQGVQFNDVPVGHPFYLHIGKLSARGVTLGCGSGNFCPDQAVTREQMAAFIMRAKGEFNPPVPGSQRFADVPPSNIFYNFIDRLAELGITLGCGGGNYCPTDPVLREQAAAFLIRGIGEFNPPTPLTQRFTDVPPTNGFYNFIDRLAALGITQGCSTTPPMYCPSFPITRAQMATFLVRAFDL